MKAESTALASVARILWRLLELHGVDPQPYFAAHGIAPSLLHQSGARVDLAAFDALMVTLASRLRDPAVFIQTADLIHPSSLGVLGYAWLSSSTLRAGFKLLVRYWGLVAGAASAPHLVDEPGALTLVFCRFTRHASAEPLTADFVLSGLVGLARLNAGERFCPIQVDVRRPRPPDTTPYADFFRCPVVFGSHQDSIRIAVADADRPLHSAEPVLSWKFDTLLLEQMAEFTHDDLSARVHWAIAKELPLGPPSPKRVGELLGMTARDLQRALSASQLTFAALLEDTRRELAMLHIGDPLRALSDIAFALGYGNQSAFTRAFQRWTGVTPAQQRATVDTSPPFASAQPLAA